MNNNVDTAREIIKELNKFKLGVRKWETEKDYAEYCEGIIMAAIAALKIISGD